MLSQVVDLIEHKSRFAITSHARPDGDSLGSSLGLYWLLRALGKSVDVLMRDPAPLAYRKLPGANCITVTPQIEKNYDAVFVIECSGVDRPALGRLDEQFVVNIDHHSTTAHFGAINWIDSTASAVGEMIYNLCKAVGVRVTKEIAECVYTALITDTGSFHYSNTSERTFKVASELVRAGVKPAKIAQSVFNSHEWSKLDLLSQVLATAKRDETGTVAWMLQTSEMLGRAEASDKDSENFVNYPMSVGAVETVAFFKECAPSFYRISLRSKGDVNVARVAEQFGGGGHRNAAGCTFSGEWAAAETAIVSALQEAVETSHEEHGLPPAHATNNGTSATNVSTNATPLDISAPRTERAI